MYSIIGMRIWKKDSPLSGRIRVSLLSRSVEEVVDGVCTRFNERVLVRDCIFVGMVTVINIVCLLKDERVITEVIVEQRCRTLS